MGNRVCYMSGTVSHDGYPQNLAGDKSVKFRYARWSEKLGPFLYRTYIRVRWIEPSPFAQGFGGKLPL